MHAGLKQRCWVHLDRDLDALKEKYPEDASVVDWVGQVLGVYWCARDTIEINYSARERRLLRGKFEAEALALAEPYLATKAAPQHVLAKRIDNFLDELFTVVEHPEVPSENNAAERSIRPAVIARKVSGGTRSGKGSKSKSILMSLFGTWSAQGLNTLEACQQMIVYANRDKLARSL